MMIVQEYWPELLTVYVACLVAFTSPGPNFVAITSYSVESRAAGYGVAIGISVGTAIWALFAATGPLRKAYIKYKPIFSIVFGIVFIGYGLRIFYTVLLG